MERREKRKSEEKIEIREKIEGRECMQRVSRGGPRAHRHAPSDRHGQINPLYGGELRLAGGRAADH